MGLFSKSEKKKIIAEHGKTFAEDVFRYQYTNYYCSDKYMRVIDPRKLVSWQLWSLSPDAYKIIYKGEDFETFKQVCVDNIANEKLTKELKRSGSKYLCTDMIDSFEEYYPPIDYQFSRKMQGQVYIYDFIDHYGEIKGYSFLVAFHTSVEYFQEIKGKRDSQRLASEWMRKLGNKIREEFGTEGYNQYMNEFGPGKDFVNNSAYIGLLSELDSVKHSEYSNPFLRILIGGL